METSYTSFPLGPTDAVISWFAKRLNGAPTTKDVYRAGKELYELGLYEQAASALGYYVTMRQSEPVGNHLLGYAHFMMKSHVSAVQELVKFVNDGFDQDWQLIVEARLAGEADGEYLKSATATATATATASTAEPRAMGKKILGPWAQHGAEPEDSDVEQFSAPTADDEDG